MYYLQHIYCLFPQDMADNILFLQSPHLSEKQNYIINLIFIKPVLIVRDLSFPSLTSCCLVNSYSPLSIFSSHLFMSSRIHHPKRKQMARACYWCGESLKSPTTEHPSVSDILICGNILHSVIQTRKIICNLLFVHDLLQAVPEEPITIYFLTNRCYLLYSSIT